MKVNFLTLSGDIHQLELDPDMRISDIKNILAEKLISGNDVSLLLDGITLERDLKLSEIHINPMSKIIIAEPKTKPLIPDTIPMVPSYGAYEDLGDEPDGTMMRHKEEEETFEPPPPKVKKPRKPRSTPKDPEDFDELVSQLVELGFEAAPSRIALRRNAYNIESAAAHLFEQNRVEEISSSSTEPDEDDDDVEFDSEGEEIRRPHFLSRKNEDLGDFQQAYEDLTADEKDIVSDISQQTKTPLAQVIQIYMACDKNQDTTIACLSSTDY